jgi:hypothetical protein
MAKNSVLLEITGSVYDAKGKLTGRVPFEDLTEAKRLVDLGVAKFVDAPAGAIISDGTVGEEPQMSWKKEEICSFLEEKKIQFVESVTKEVLIKTYEDWKAAQQN